MRALRGNALHKSAPSLPSPARRRPRRFARETRHASLLLFVFLIALFPHRAAAAEHQSENARRPKVGLALSGGGARGAAHIGVLKVLEEHRIRVDYIAGTSMGAIVGGLYASGMSAAELEEMISHVDWADAFTDFIPRKDRSFRRKRDDDLYLVKNKPGLSGRTLKFPTGILDGQKIDLLLKRHALHAARIRDFDDLGIPFRAVAANLETGAPVVIGTGDLAAAMRASMSIPVVFAPREIEGRLLTDGGISVNLPIDVVRGMGADIVIAVDISTPLLEREELQSVIAVTDQLMTIMTRRGTDSQIASLADGDVFICPDLGTITTASFDRAAEAIPAGVDAAESVLGKLAGLSVPPEEWSAYEAARGRREPSPVIDEIRIINESRLDNAVIAERFDVETGEPLDVDRLERSINQIFGLELFESISYELAGESARTALTVRARERSWGPNYVQFGVAVFEDFEGPNFNLSAAYARTAVNRLGAEWRTGMQIGREPELFSEFYQPLGRSLRPFVHIKASIGERAESVFDADGNKLSELGLRRGGIELAGGRELGTWGELRAGIIRESGTIETLIGDPDAPDVDFDTGELFAQFFIDRLDDLDFPRNGGALRIRTTAGRTELGSGEDYEQWIAEGEYAHSIGSNTGRLGGYFATTQDDDSPYERLFYLGGFTRLSGLERRELKGQHAALLSATAYRRFFDLAFLSMYAGLSVEYGNVFQERERMRWDAGILAGSAFIGLRTPIGPMYLAYGLAERGRENFYLFLGRSI